MVLAGFRIFQLRLHWNTRISNRPNILWPATIFAVTDKSLLYTCLKQFKSLCTSKNPRDITQRFSLAWVCRRLQSKISRIHLMLGVATV
ncbi:hypothetical protein LL05_05110 [Pseudomonas aeruginosa]|nr:hypothetical protein LL05_05110 [Pseudomonas aeruginosa]